MFAVALEFQPGTNGRRRLRGPGWDRWLMCVMAMGATVERPFALPVGDALAVGAEIPVLVAIRMTPTTNQVCIVEVHRFSEKRRQITAGIKIVTRYAPDSSGPVFQLNLMRRIELPYLGSGLHSGVALNARVE